MKSDIYELTRYVSNWSSQHIGEKDPEIMLSKLIDELVELKEKPCDGHEMADIMIIFLDYCDTVGVDIVKAVHYKMKINERREWELDENGKLQHKKSATSGIDDSLAYCKYCEGAILGGTPVECYHDIDKPCLADAPPRERHFKVSDVLPDT